MHGIFGLTRARSISLLESLFDVTVEVNVIRDARSVVIAS